MHLGTEIISADSRQCYRELNIGVARPSKEELSQVPHHFIASHSVTEEINAAGFADYALSKTQELFRDHAQVVLAGGTGLYIRAYCEGLDEIPSVPDAVRSRIQQDYAEKGLGWLQEEIRNHDPRFYASGETQNPQRLMRALEVWQATGRSILDFRTGEKQERPFRIIRIGLELPRELLRERIAQRVELMMKEGLVEEVKTLLPWRRLNALQTVGYAEIFDYLDGNITLQEAVSRIVISTRQYAKRQMTWFKKDPAIHWFDPREEQTILSWLDEQLARKHSTN